MSGNAKQSLSCDIHVLAFHERSLARQESVDFESPFAEHIPGLSCRNHAVDPLASANTAGITCKVTPPIKYLNGRCFGIVYIRQVGVNCGVLATNFFGADVSWNGPVDIGWRSIKLLRRLLEYVHY